MNLGIIFFTAIIIPIGWGSLLKKKHTIRLPLVTSVGGSILPLSKVCTSGVQMLLDVFNNQTEYLPDYNVVVDLIDDGCNPMVALPKLIPMYMEPKLWTNLSSLDGTGKTFLPSEMVFERNGAEKAFHLPILTGPICSTVCRVIGQLPQHFKTIEITVGCTDPTVDDRQRFGNLYRQNYPVSYNAYTRAIIMNLFNWTEVGMIVEATFTTYQEAKALIEISETNGFKIMVDEIYTTDPSDSIRRLKESDTRIIHAICYINTCPLVACEASRQGLYGPTIVWIFSADISLSGVNPKNIQPWCNQNMINKISNGAIFAGYDNNGFVYPDFKSSVGISPRDLQAYVAEAAPRLKNTPLFHARSLCLEIVLHGLMVISSAEKQLRMEGKDLIDHVSDAKNADDMESRFRKAVLTLDFNSTLGHSRVSPESNADFYTTTIPYYMVEQDRGGQRIPVAWRQHGEALQMFHGETFKWKTFDGMPPKDRLIVNYISMKFPLGIVILLKVIAALFLSWAIATICLLIKVRKCNGYLDTFRRFNSVMVVGCIVPTLAIFTFPTYGSSSDIFCNTASITSIIGLHLVMGSITTKVMAVSFCRYRGPIRNYNKIKLHSTLMFIAIALVVACLVILQAFVGGLPVAHIHENIPTTDASRLAVLNIQKWTFCKANTFFFGWASLGVVLLYGMFGLFTSATISQKKERFLYISDMKLTQTFGILIFPLTVVYILALVSFSNHTIQLAILATFSFVQSFIILSGLWWWKLAKQDVLLGYSNRFEPNLF